MELHLALVLRSPPHMVPTMLCPRVEDLYCPIISVTDRHDIMTAGVKPCTSAPQCLPP